MTKQWPASPEYYNSALVVSSDGETIANYRKSFLYYTDETWALEGRDGFFRGRIPGLGRVALGICMDLKYVCSFLDHAHLAADISTVHTSLTPRGMPLSSACTC